MPVSAQQISADTPYSMEVFVWLMENSSAKSYLDEITLKRIDDAIASNDDRYLKTIYKIILNTFIEERNAELNRAVSSDLIMDGFTERAETDGKILKEENKKRIKKSEAEDKKIADNILKKLTD